MHRLADHVFAQHRADGGKPIAAPGERGGSRPLEVQIAPRPARSDEFAEQQRTPVAESGAVPTELVSGVGLRHRRGPVGHEIAQKESQAVRASQPRRIEAQFGGKRLVECKQLRLGGVGGLPRNGQFRQFACEAAIEDDGSFWRNAHDNQITEPSAVAASAQRCDRPVR